MLLTVILKTITPDKMTGKLMYIPLSVEYYSTSYFPLIHYSKISKMCTKLRYTNDKLRCVDLWGGVPGKFVRIEYGGWGVGWSGEFKFH